MPSNEAFNASEESARLAVECWKAKRRRPLRPIPWALPLGAELIEGEHPPVDIPTIQTNLGDRVLSLVWTHVRRRENASNTIQIMLPNHMLSEQIRHSLAQRLRVAEDTSVFNDLVTKLSLEFYRWAMEHKNTLGIEELPSEGVFMRTDQR